MTCRHGPGDMNCSKNSSRYDPPDPPKTPDKKNYTIEQAEVVGRHLVMKVKYPNCSNCSYEGLKIMVFLEVNIVDALKRREIDPHFKEKSYVHRLPTQAPSPAARFPGSSEGWGDALNYARGKVGDDR